MKAHYTTCISMSQEEFDKKEELKKKGVSIMAIFREGLEHLFKKIVVDKKG